MKHTKKILAILLVAAMAFSLIACAVSEEESADPTPTSAPTSPPTSPGQSGETPTEPEGPGPDIDDTISTEPITLKVMQWELDNQTMDFENLWYYKQMEAYTNVTIEWEVVKESEWNERMNTMYLAGLSGLPDIIIRPNDSLNIEEYGVTQGYFIALDDHMNERTMPNYYPRLAMNNVTDVMRSSDGKMYYIGYLVAQDINHEGHFFMNKTWLDAVGKAVPTTVDELTDVLRAFKSEAPGAANMWPMSAGGGLDHHIQGFYNYFGMFGVPLQRYLYAHIDDSGKVLFPGYMPGFREALEWFAMCYAEGLLDPDALTQSENAWNSKINNDQVGFATYLRLYNSAWTNPETIENWISIIPPAGSQGAKVPRILELPQYGAVLTVANEHVARSLQWLDLQFATEWMMTAVNGPIEMTDEVIALLGDDISPNDDGVYEAPMYVENGVWKIRYVPENQSLYKIVPINQGQFFAPGDYYFDIYDPPPHRIERRENAIKYNNAGVMEKYSYDILRRIITMTNEDDAERQRLFVDIETFMKENITQFILNGVTDSSWDRFLTEAEGVGVARYLELYQTYYDEYARRFS